MDGDPARHATGQNGRDMRTLRLGTRASTLAITQSEGVAEAFRALGWTVELVPVRTEGDRRPGPLAEMGGTGVFVTALRVALRENRVDLAVHSLKDLPTAPAPGILLAAVPEREDPRDALCARNGWTLADLPSGARVGTGSPRRAAQLRLSRPDLDVVGLRGNVDSRLARVTGHTPPETPGAPETPTGRTHPAPPEELAAVVLARAGLARLGRLDAVTEALPPAVMLPAPGQGALAVECRSADASRIAGRDTFGALDHLPTRLAVTAERALLARLEAGCSAPVGALASMDDDGSLRLEAIAVTHDGRPVRAHRRTPRATPTSAAELGRRLADTLLARGLLTGAPPAPTSTPPTPERPSDG